MDSVELAIQQSDNPAGVALPPLWDRPSPAAEYFDKAASALLPAVGVANRLTVLTLICPVGHNGVIAGISNVVIGGVFSDFSGGIIWRLFKDAVPVRNYSNILFSLGSLALPQQTFIEILDGDSVTFTVETTVAFGAVPTAVRLKGWWYPIS
ncbi:MAG TPA: hypothetical protein VMV34_06585 [Terriglobia bacterium]|nr:hypothetical protein [Terriglobia bacterium]